MGSPRWKPSSHAKRSALFAAQSSYVEPPTARWNSILGALNPKRSKTSIKVMSRYRSSYRPPNMVEVIGRFSSQFIFTSSGIIFCLYLNSVGPPYVQPIICPAQPPLILSASSLLLSSSFFSVQAASAKNADKVAATVSVILLIFFIEVISFFLKCYKNYAEKF